MLQPVIIISYKTMSINFKLSKNEIIYKKEYLST